MLLKWPYSLHTGQGEEVVERHSQYFQKVFTLKFEDQNEGLQVIYWIPKLHPNPVRFRFITVCRVIFLILS